MLSFVSFFHDHIYFPPGCVDQGTGGGFSEERARAKIRERVRMGQLFRNLSPSSSWLRKKENKERIVLVASRSRSRTLSISFRSFFFGLFVVFFFASLLLVPFRIRPPLAGRRKRERKRETCCKWASPLVSLFFGRVTATSRLQLFAPCIMLVQVLPDVFNFALQLDWFVIRQARVMESFFLLLALFRLSCFVCYAGTYTLNSAFGSLLFVVFCFNRILYGVSNNDSWWPYARVDSDTIELNPFTGECSVTACPFLSGVIFRLLLILCWYERDTNRAPLFFFKFYVLLLLSFRPVIFLAIDFVHLRCRIEFQRNR